MNPTTIIENLRSGIDKILHVEWLSTAVTIVVVLLITAILSHLVTMVIRKVMHVDSNPLPSSSIFINIGRVVVWSFGICVILSSCFGIDVTAALTALGIGGLAISLGFQSTLSNLISGLQISLTKLVMPGNRIKVGGNVGIVDDVTWRHTSIITTRGEHVIIPNSVINTEALIKLPSERIVHQHITLLPQGGDLAQMIENTEADINKKISSMTLVEQKAKIDLVDVTEHGYSGMLSYALGEGANVGDVKNAALKIVADHNEAAERASVERRSSERASAKNAASIHAQAKEQ